MADFQYKKWSEERDFLCGNRPLDMSKISNKTDFDALLVFCSFSLFFFKNSHLYP